MAGRRGRPASPASRTAMTLRTAVRREDGEVVRDIVSSTGFFRPDEIDIAVELVEERLRVGLASGYHFIFAERSGRVLGYSCYGPVPLTLHSYDIYWMAVRKEEQGAGFGTMLLERSEAAIREMGGRRIYIETSSRELYSGTRRFYEHCGYRAEATLGEFYSPGDDKVIYVKATGPVKKSGIREEGEKVRR